MGLHEVAHESRVMTPKRKEMLTSVVVPRRLWDRIRILLQMHSHINAELQQLEDDEFRREGRNSLRSQILRDLAKADGSEAQHMEDATLEYMYGTMASTLIKKYNITIKEDTNGKANR